MPTQESLQTPSLAQMISLKIQQGKESVLPVELEQLRSFLGHQDDDTIPYLNRSYLQSGKIPSEGSVTLVRYRGMVQDMLDSEFYVSEMDGVKTKYRDYCSSSSDVVGMEKVAKHLEERQLLVVVPVPFAVKNDARKEAMKTEQHFSSSNSNTAVARVNNKRSLEDFSQGEEPPVRKQHQPVMIRDSPDSNSNQMNSSNLDWWPAGCMGSDPNQCPVLAKLYYEDNQEQLKLNQVVDMIGVLSLSPLDAVHDKDDDDMMLCDDLVIPPPSLLPRLHVLCYNPIDIHDAMSCKEDVNMDTEANFVEDRTFCLQILSNKVCGGNDTAAEALMMVLLSMAECQEIKGSWSPIQMTEDTTLGCASLKLVLANQEACVKMQQGLQQVLSSILPVVASTNMSLTAPRKNDSGRLEPSVLQLPKGAVLLIRQDGVESASLAAVSALTKSHVVPYVFEGGMSFNFEADVSVIVLSFKEQSNKLLPCTMSMSIKETSSILLTDDDCSRIRSYIHKCRGRSPHGANNIELSRNVLKVAQQDFVARRVQQRQIKKPESNEEDFHRWLTLTRLEARSRVGVGNELHCASVDDWKLALRLDDAMRTSE